MEDRLGARAEGIKDDIWQLNRTSITMGTKEYNPMNAKKEIVFREHTKILKAASWKVLPAVVTGSGVHYRVHEAVKGAGGTHLTTLSTATSIQRRWPLRMKYHHGGENRGTWRKSYPSATSCTTKSKISALISNMGYRGQRPSTDRLSGELQVGTSLHHQYHASQTSEDRGS
jgi:hypothetical protein